MKMSQSLPLLLICLVLFVKTSSLVISPLRMSWSPSQTISQNSEYASPRKKYGLSSNYKKGISTIVPSPTPPMPKSPPEENSTEPILEELSAPAITPSVTPPVDVAPATEVSTLKQRLFEEIKSGSLLKIYRIVEQLTSYSQGNEKLVGNWRLVFSDDDKTRASPFFWAFKQAFKGTQIPKFMGISNFADGVFLVTDTIPSALKKIGTVKQFVSSDGKLVSQVEIISPIGTSVMTTTSHWSALSPDSCGSSTVELRVDTTRVLDSTVQKLLNIPGSSPLLSGFPSGAALELVSPGSSTVRMNNLYLDDSLRISRSPDDKIFIFERSPLSDKHVGL